MTYLSNKKITIKSIIPSAYLVLIYLFILSPMLVVIIGSFNSALSYPSKFDGFTIHWYKRLFEYRQFIVSFAASLRIGIGAAAMALILGIPLSMLFVRHDFPGKNTINSFFMTPLVMPQIVLSIALLQMFSMARIPAGELTLILAHTIIVIPFVLRACIASMSLLDPSIEEAAMNLGANPFQTFILITLPQIRTGVIAGFVLSFIVSFINIPLSIFLSTPECSTLPIRVLTYMESRMDPMLAAIGALTIYLVTAVSLFLEKAIGLRLIV